MKELKERLTVRTVFIYVLGIFIVSLGSATSVRSNLGCGPAVSLCYTATLITGVDFGITTFIWMVFLLIMQAVVLRKDFRPYMILQVIAGFLISYFNHLGLWVIDLFPAPVTLAHRFLYSCFSTVFGALGVWLYTSVGLINLPTEGIVAAVSQKTKKEFHLIKVIYDITCVTLSGVICLIRLHTLGSVGIGTIFVAMTLGFVLGFYRKVFRKPLEKFIGMKAAI